MGRAPFVTVIVSHPHGEWSMGMEGGGLNKQLFSG